MNEVCVPAALGAKGGCDQDFNARVHAEVDGATKMVCYLEGTLNRPGSMT